MIWIGPRRRVSFWVYPPLVVDVKIVPSPKSLKLLAGCDAEIKIQIKRFFPVYYAEIVEIMMMCFSFNALLDADAGGMMML